MTSTTAASGQQQTVASKDRRKHRRIRLQKPEHVLVKVPQSSIIAADLLDVSVSGVRISYKETYLTPGTGIVLCYSWGNIPARVVWTAVNATTILSGLAFTHDDHINGVPTIQKIEGHCGAGGRSSNSPIRGK